MSPAGFGTKNHFAGEGQQQFTQHTGQNVIFLTAPLLSVFLSPFSHWRFYILSTYNEIIYDQRQWPRINNSVWWLAGRRRVDIEAVPGHRYLFSLQIDEVKCTWLISFSLSLATWPWHCACDFLCGLQHTHTVKCIWVVSICSEMGLKRSNQSKQYPPPSSLSPLFFLQPPPFRFSCFC
jgi:hypothetical protein